MTTIYLVRHGQDEDNANGILNGRRDSALTSIGIDQAHQTAERIASLSLHFDKVYTSPLQRAYKTAETITKRLGISRATILQELIERELGVMSGKPHTMIEELCAPAILKTNIVTYFLHPEGAETFPQLLIRAKKLLKHLKVKHEKDTILLVTHGDFGKMLYAAYYDLAWIDVLKQFHFGNADILELSELLQSEQSFIYKVKQYNL